MGDLSIGGQGRRRQLTPAEKYEVWCKVIAKQGTQRGTAGKWDVARCKVVHIVKTTKFSSPEPELPVEALRTKKWRR